MPTTLPDLQDWRFTVDFEGIAWAVVDREGESMNSLGRRTTEELGEIVAAVEEAGASGEVKRFHGNDWLAEAEAKGVLTASEARALAELRDLVARVIAVDDFSPSELARRQSPASEDSATRPEHIAAE